MNINQRNEKAKTKFDRQNLSFFFSFFGLLFSKSFFVVGDCHFPTIDDVTYAYHIVDYSVGFCTKLLPGAIFNFFFKNPTELKATLYENIILFAVFISVSYILTRLMSSLEYEDKKAVFLFFCLFLISPASFSTFSFRLGMLDVYWIVFSLLFLFLLKNRKLSFLIPVIYAITLLVHFSSMISYIVMFSILLLYESSTRDKKKFTLAVFFFSVIITLCTFLYFLANEKSNVLLSMDEFHKLIESRGGKYFIYYDYSLYGEVSSYGWLVPNLQDFNLFADSSSPIAKVINIIFATCGIIIYIYGTKPEIILWLVTTLLLELPVLVVAYNYLSGKLKEEKGNKLKQFSLFLVMCQFPFTQIIGCLFTVDVIRISTHAFICFMTMLIYVLYKENGFKNLRRIISSFRINKYFLSVYFAIYFLTVFDPYP